MSLTLRSTDLEWRRIDEEVVVLDARNSAYLALNTSAAVLWTSLAAGASREELADRLVETYGIEAGQAIEDTDGFISALAERGLLVPGAPANRFAGLRDVQKMNEHMGRQAIDGVAG